MKAVDCIVRFYRQPVRNRGDLRNNRKTLGMFHQIMQILVNFMAHLSDHKFLKGNIGHKGKNRDGSEKNQGLQEGETEDGMGNGKSHLSPPSA